MLKKSASGVPASLRGAMYHTNTPQNIVNYGWTISILLLPECTNMYHETGPGLGHSRVSSRSWLSAITGREEGESKNDVAG